jgi:hypothetical protein
MEGHLRQAVAASRTATADAPRCTDVRSRCVTCPEGARMHRSLKRCWLAGVPTLGGASLGTEAAVHLINMGARVGAPQSALWAHSSNVAIVAPPWLRHRIRPRVYRVGDGLAVAGLCFGMRRFANFTRGSQRTAFVFALSRCALGVRCPPRKGGRHLRVSSDKRAESNVKSGSESAFSNGSNGRGYKCLCVSSFIDRTSPKDTAS